MYNDVTTHPAEVVFRTPPLRIITRVLREHFGPLLSQRQLAALTRRHDHMAGTPIAANVFMKQYLAGIRRIVIDTTADVKRQRVQEGYNTLPHLVQHPESLGTCQAIYRQFVRHEWGLELQPVTPASEEPPA